MSPYPSKLYLCPSVCLHLLCLLLLLLIASSSTVPIKDPVTAEPPTQLKTTQANCTPSCDNDTVSENTTDLHLKTAPSDRSHQDLFSSNSSSSINHTSVSHKLNDPILSSTSFNQSEGGNHSATAPQSNQQPALPNPQSPSPETVTQLAVPPPPPTTTGSATQAAHTGSTTSTATATSTIAEPVKNVYTTTVLVTSTAATTPASTTITATSTTKTTSTTMRPTSTAAAAAPPHLATTTLTRATTSVTITPTTGTKMTPPPPAATTQPNTPTTRKPPIQTSLPRGPVTSTSAPRQLVDTASLLAVLLFGLLFFLVTVAVFVTQAYDSYRRKDYTQVDYLINGMYTDSGV